jgi:hypothetical protein
MKSSLYSKHEHVLFVMWTHILQRALGYIIVIIIIIIIIFVLLLLFFYYCKH